MARSLHPFKKILSGLGLVSTLNFVLLRVLFVVLKSCHMSQIIIVNHIKIIIQFVFIVSTIFNLHYSKWLSSV